MTPRLAWAWYRLDSGRIAQVGTGSQDTYQACLDGLRDASLGIVLLPEVPADNKASIYRHHDRITKYGFIDPDTRTLEYDADRLEAAGKTVDEIESRPVPGPESPPAWDGLPATRPRKATRTERIR